MEDDGYKSVLDLTTFIVQIVSAVSGFIMFASVLFLRKWHPPVAYTATFRISLWIGIQSLISHSASAVSLRLSDASTDLQRNEHLIRFLLWSQFAMPLWFVFLNVAIATDFMLTQLKQWSRDKVELVRQWYVPVATGVAFVLTLPLLIYHSGYQTKPTTSFSVQFKSKRAATIYYIMAFDLWVAFGIIYCFVIILLVAGKMAKSIALSRRYRAHLARAWPSQLENLIVTDVDIIPPEEGDSSAIERQRSTRDTRGVSVTGSHSRVPQSRRAVEFIDVEYVRTFTSSNAVVSETSESHTEAGKELMKGTQSPDTGHLSQLQPAELSSNAPVEEIEMAEQTRSTVKPTNQVLSFENAPGDTLVDMDDRLLSAIQSLRISNVSGTTKADKFLSQLPGPRQSVQTDMPTQQTLNGIDETFPRLDDSTEVEAAEAEHRLRNVYASGTTAIEIPPTIHFAAQANDHRSQPLRALDAISSGSNSETSSPYADPRNVRQNRRRPKLRLENLAAPLHFRHSRTGMHGNSPGNNAPFAISPMVLVRMLLYPLIPICTLTVMCVVRWLYLLAKISSQFILVNEASGMLKAMQGFLCLIVFLLNPALNRSFREIRKRSTPVFTD